MTFAGIPLGGADPAAVSAAVGRWAAAAGAAPDGSLPGRTIELFDPTERRGFSFDAGSLGVRLDLERSAELVRTAGRERGSTVFGVLRGLIGCSTLGRDIAPAVAVDRAKLTLALGAVRPPLDVLPTNASLDPRTGRVREGAPGRLVDSAGTASAVSLAVSAAAGAGGWRVPIVFKSIPPRGDPARLAQLDRSLLGSFTTTFDVSEEGRSWNIALACARLDGTIIEPGGVISFNALVGARVPEAGFREAPELVDNELVPGFGGGVCQVATTLFNAALLADLEIVERYHHSRPVTYVGLGRDATVSYPNLDLVVRNPRAFPVILTAEALDGQVTVSFWGRRTIATEVRLWVEEMNLKPAENLVQVVPDLAPGEVRVAKPAFDGRDVRLWRQTYQEGRPVRLELIWVDHYEPIAGLVQVGAGTAGTTGAGAEAPAPGAGAREGDQVRSRPGDARDERFYSPR